MSIQKEKTLSISINGLRTEIVPLVVSATEIFFATIIKDEDRKTHTSFRIEINGGTTIQCSSIEEFDSKYSSSTIVKSILITQICKEFTVVHMLVQHNPKVSIVYKANQEEQEISLAYDVLMNNIADVVRRINNGTV